MKTMPTFEIIIPLTVWRPALMRLSANRSQIAVGPFERDPWREPTGLLVSELRLTNQSRGADYAPMGDWIVVAAPDGEPPANPEAWIQRLEPRFAQMLVILLVGYGPDRSDWRGWIVERGVIQPIAGLRIIGPRMVHASSLPISISEDHPERWSRVRGSMDEATFAKLRNAKVGVIGCSRTGTLIATTLAALGVRELTLIDGDKIEHHNLDGMILANEADIGDSKAIVLGRRLIDYRPDLLVRAVGKPFLNRATEVHLAGADLIVTCVDRDAPRLRAAIWAREHLTPHLDIGAGVTRNANGDRLLAADVRLMLPGSGCACCVGGLTDREQAEYELHAPPGALPRRPEEPWNARGRLGSLITLNSMAVSTGVQSWLDLLEGSLGGSIWHRLRWIPGTGLQSNAALVGAGPGCYICDASQVH
jgi:hypothetical protein